MTHPAATRRGARGSVTLEIAILGPVMLLLVFALVQTVLWYYARGLAIAAAQQGASAAAAYGATSSTGAAHARDFLAGQDSLRDIQVSTTGSTRTEVRVEVTGRALSVLPGVAGIVIQQSAYAPVERFTLPGGSP
jgi:Flp pilus assembly protein TadG